MFRISAKVILLMSVVVAYTSHAQTFTVLANFDAANGINSQFGTLVQGPDGNLYGVQQYGGDHYCHHGCGTIFRVTPAGRLSTIHTFEKYDGNRPTGLVLATDGNLYGVASDGGPNGIIFRVTPGGVFSVAANFDKGTGYSVNGIPIQGPDGNLYDDAEDGGANGLGTS